jgi:dUTP pyrophosphatase
MSPYTDIVLKIFVPPEHSTLRAFYRQRIDDHNHQVFNSSYADSGFDLGLPTDLCIHKICSNKIPLGIHCSMYMSVYSPTDNRSLFISQAYYLYPRSSIIKTPLRLSNSVGIIDRGYRGEITAVVDNVDHTSNSYEVHAMERYFQICHPTLTPFKVVMVNSKEELGFTQRGSGGFGSTGR